jgi:ribosome-associated protein
VIRVTGRVTIDERELDEQFIRSSGPGGQNVNKVETAVQLRFDAARSPGLPDDIRARLMVLAGSRLTQEGVIVITAQRFRSQDRNRQDARERLFALIREAAVVPRTRRATRPTLASKVRRLDGKTKRGDVKRMRRDRPDGD